MTSNRSPALAAALHPLGEVPPRWTLQLLGRFQLADGQRVHTRLATRAVTALLARLALWPQRDHAREELAELLWPGVDAETGRRRLRQALSLLKDVLEPAEHGLAPVLQADRLNLRLVAGALQCDVHAFERGARTGQGAAALAVYPGDLLPGFYDEWIVDERQRLASLHDELLRRAPVAAGPAVPAAVPATAPATASPSGLPQPTEPTSLPSFLTRYHADASQLARLAERVQEHRWVTLVGPGGGGKTRLAVELARRMQTDTERHFDQVVFVPLVDALQRQQAIDRLASALRIEASNPTVDAVIARLAGRKTLLVLDNCEQLAGLTEDLWLQLTAAVPGLHLLLTSRRSLVVDGEQLFPIAPLAWPAADASVQAVASSPAVALFVDRAMAVRADFHVSPRNHAVLADLMAALEGMPLAIELAASRLRSVSPAEMLQRLRLGPETPGDTPRLDLLVRPSERSAADPRHASMLRTIAWSWQQLDTPQRLLAGAMTVFGGGCSLRMLQHVSGGGAQVALVLEQLLSHSMVQLRQADAGADGDSRRFHLYEPVREYAAAQFDAAQAAHWRARHRAWAIAWARALPVTPALAEVRAELPNIAAALHSAATDGAGDDAVHLLLALHHTLEDVELPHAALDHASAAVDACSDALLRSRGHSAVGPLLYAAGQKDASLRHVEAALQHLPADPGQRGRALYAAARLRWRSDLQHPERVLPLLDEAFALAEAAGDHYLMAGVLSARAFAVHVQDGTPDNALALHRRALQHWQRFGNRHAVNIGRFNVAVFEFHSGRAALALAEFDALAAEAAVLQDWRRLSVANDARGTVLAALRRWPEAAQAHRESLALAWQSMSIYNLAHVFWNLPRALAHLRQPVLALRLAAFSEVFWQERLGSLTPSDARDLLRVRRLAARQLSPRDCAEAWARGRLLTLAEAMALALER
jgi:predicted ATPase